MLSCLRESFHTPDCFINEGQYKAGFAKKLLLKKGSVPTIRVPAAPPEEVSECNVLLTFILIFILIFANSLHASR